MLRPEARVLPDESLVPEQNLVRPPPGRLTHELVEDEPYRFDRRGGEPDGVLPAGTRVALLEDGPERCRIATGDGLGVEVRRASLRELPDC
jgi:hypothetical protein